MLKYISKALEILEDVNPFCDKKKFNIKVIIELKVSVKTHIEDEGGDVLILTIAIDLSEN